MATVYEAESPSVCKPVKVTLVPTYYHPHIIQFLWHYYLLSFLRKASIKVLLAPAVEFIKHMLVMLDTVLEQLLLRCKQHPRLTHDFCVPAFDQYLVTEFVVGFHNPIQVEDWHNHPENRDRDLEQIYPDTLGKSKFNMDICNVKLMDWKMVADALQEWYSIPMQSVTAAEKRVINRTGPPPPVVSGVAGQGYKLTAEADTEGEPDEEYAERVRRKDEGKGKAVEEAGNAEEDEEEGSQAEGEDQGKKGKNKGKGKKVKGKGKGKAVEKKSDTEKSDVDENKEEDPEEREDKDKGVGGDQEDQSEDENQGAKSEGGSGVDENEAGGDSAGQGDSQRDGPCSSRSMPTKSSRSGDNSSSSSKGSNTGANNDKDIIMGEPSLAAPQPTPPSDDSASLNADLLNFLSAFLMIDSCLSKCLGKAVEEVGNAEEDKEEDCVSKFI
ncbi:hypothetical protein BDN67DRAFT_985693 [Paxillus ammoniavirescens]|nr:hypothetical protein BDN67DRAFT_985693 [Paxillus ammoniavirescens]